MLHFRYSPFEDDVLLMGRGGTGKTHLLRKAILPSLKNVAWWLYDTRHQYGDVAEATHTIADLPYGQAVYQPYEASDTDFEAFCAKANTWSNLVVAVEEAHLFVGKYKIRSKSFEHIIKAGRPKGVTWIVITRRPQMLHNDILSDAEHIFCFELELPSDLLYVQKWIGEEVQLFLPPDRRMVEALRSQPVLPEHSFVYKRIDAKAEVGRL